MKWKHESSYASITSEKSTHVSALCALLCFCRGNGGCSIFIKGLLSGPGMVCSFQSVCWVMLRLTSCLWLRILVCSQFCIVWLAVRLDRFARCACDAHRLVILWVHYLYRLILVRSYKSLWIGWLLSPLMDQIICHLLLGSLIAEMSELRSRKTMAWIPLNSHAKSL